MPTQTEPTAELYTKAIAFMTEFFGHPLELDQDAREKWYRDHGLLIQFIEQKLKPEIDELRAIFPDYVDKDVFSIPPGAKITYENRAIKIL